MSRIYLDYNSTSPMLPGIKEKIYHYFDSSFANPSSVYHEGRAAREAIEQSREDVASLLGARAENIVFTSGGTESNNTVFNFFDVKNTVAAVSAIEHPSVLLPAEMFSVVRGGKLYKIPVGPDGIIDLVFLENLLLNESKQGKRVLVSVMYVNNETGVIQPMKQVLELVKKYGAISHSDAVAAIGRVSFSVLDLPVDLLTVSGHKIYAPKGSGCLFISEKLGKLKPFMLGGHQEKGRRAGTENVPSIVGFGAACKWIKENMEKENTRIEGLSSFLLDRLKEEVPSAIINTPVAAAVPGTLNISIPGCTGEDIMINLDLMGVSISTGSACLAGASGVSHVLQAMKLPEDTVKGAIRISMGSYTNKEELNKFVMLLKKTIKNLNH